MEQKYRDVNILESEPAALPKRSVREFMLPNYKKIKAFAKKHDIPVISLDTDGNCSELVPLFMEAGINLIFPLSMGTSYPIFP